MAIEDPNELQKEVRKASVGIGTKLLTSLAKLLTGKSDKYQQEYKKVLEASLKQFSDLLSAYSESKEARKFVLYYLQPIEIEAYAVGFMRGAKLQAEEEVRKSRGRLNKRELIKKYFNERVAKYKQMLTDFNTDLFRSSFTNKKKLVDIATSNSAALDLIDKFESELKKYATSRYASLNERDQMFENWKRYIKK